MYNVCKNTESAAYIELKIWEITSPEIKNIDSSTAFNKELSQRNLITAFADYVKSIFRMLILLKKSVERFLILMRFYSFLSLFLFLLLFRFYHRF